MEGVNIHIADDLDNALRAEGIEINIPDKPETAIRREGCICKVPDPIRDVRKEAYTPRLVSIGLIHYRNRNESMESRKTIYLKEFCGRFKTEVASGVFKNLMKIIREEMQNIINCYEDRNISGVGDPGLAKMILLDAVFIMELFLRKSSGKEYNDLIIRRPLLGAAVQQDLLLLENQLPFNILDRLYKRSFSNFEEKNYPDSFLKLTCDYFSSCWLGFPPMKNIQVGEVKHFTDVVRHLWLADNLGNPRQEIFPYPEIFAYFKTYVPSATILHNKAGVEFESLSRFVGPPEVTFKGRKYLAWKRGKLIMSPIKIGNNTEVIIRNIMVLEICYYPSESYICSYCRLLDYLINTVEDVNLLVEAGIIYNHLGDNARIVDMVNKLCYGINEGVNCYFDLFDKLEAFYQSKDNRRWAPLKRVYFKDTWTSTATIVAAFVIVLQIAQTFSSIWQIAHVSK